MRFLRIHLFLVVVFCALPAFINASNKIKTKNFIVKTPFQAGINEIIPAKFIPQYQKWKAELLATEFGRQQWEKYAQNDHFSLTIKIDRARGQGAGTEDYLWNDDGELIGATIYLGKKLDSGIPNPIYYPVMNSLALRETEFTINANVLAATKIIHEIGHVNQMAIANKQIVEIQTKLIPDYVDIFLKNGRNLNDPKLIELEQKIGGTPTEIWENREYWSETNAMLFLNEKIRNEKFYCTVFNKIIDNVELYAKGYEQRFEQIAESNNIAATCEK